MGGGKSIFSDLDTYIEETEDPDVREPKREGNIQGEGSRPENPQNEGNISSEGAQPQPPNRSPIDPSKGPKQDISKESIPKSPNAPEEPQRKGNIQPREFNRESGEIEGNIEADDDTQPRPANQSGNIGATDDNQPQGAQTEGNIESDDSKTPQDPRRSGNFPTREDNEPSAPNREGVINLRDFAEPDDPQTEGNIGSREENEPDAPGRSSNISSQEDNRPSEPSTEGNIDSREENQPQEPNFGISTEEENRPQEPNTEGNIQADDSVQPREPETGDIQADDSNQPPEPNRSVEAQDNNQPSEPSTEGNIQADDSVRPQEPGRDDSIETEEENRPQEPNRDENIEADDDVQPPEFQSKGGTGLIERRSTRDLQPDDRAEERPADAETEGNIEADDDAQPREPDADGNIEAEDENQPQEPSTEGNITARPENEPREPQAEDNIRGREENEPESPSTEGNIDGEDENQPQPPQTDGNISGREGNEPASPQTEGNIEGREENEPPEPQGAGNIGSREDNEPAPPQAEGNIDGEDNQPEGPQLAGNIEGKDNQPDEPRAEGNIGDREENEPDGPQTVGNIEGREENEPNAPRRDGNIDGRDENEPEEPQGTGNIEADDSVQPRELPGLERRGDRAEDDIDRLNEATRNEQFDRFFDLGRGRFDQPFILRKPEAGGGDSFTANIKQGDSRTAPAASTAEDVTRLSKFQATAEGQLFNVKQQFLQSLNPRERTRIYDPTSIIQTASAGLTSRPGLGVTRHLTATSGPFGAAGRLAEGIGNVAGFDVPTSARYEEKLDDEAIETSNFGTLRGSLIFSSPVVRGTLPEVSGEVAQQEVRNRLSSNIQDLQPLFTTTSSPNFERFAAAALSSAGNVINSYLFTKSYDPQGGPDSEGREETDTFHPGLTYIQNTETVGDRSSINPEDFEPADFSEVTQELVSRVRDARRTEREDTPSSFPFIDPRRTPSQDDVDGGGGEVRYQIQNESSTPEVFHENRVVREGGINSIPLHRGIQDSDRSRGLPNYSVENESGDRINRTDLVNRLEPLINTQGVDEETETFGSEANQFEDIIPFRFWDVENDAAIVFRAFLNGISDNLSPQWSQKDYAGRPEQAHIYSGYSNSISFDFQVAPFTQEEFAANWKKVNYLKGLTTPASYSRARGGGEFMVPPYLRLQIGDLFNDLFGYFNSLTISVDDDASWEIDRSRGNEETGRLPKVLEVSVDFQVIPERFPAAGQKYYDAPFIDEKDPGAIVGDSIEPSGDPILTQEDDAQQQQQRRTDVDNAVETIQQQTEDINAPTND